MSQALLLSSPSPSVSLHDGRPATTSLDVSKFFRKRHDAVLRDLRNIIVNCPEEFTAHNFVVSNYMDNTGRSLAMYIIFRDGFTLLAMGYTGPEAMPVQARLHRSLQPHGGRTRQAQPPCSARRSAL